MANIHIAQSRSEWIGLAANFIAETAQEALSDNDRFIVALSGGNTPRPVYEAMPELWQRYGLSWDCTHLIWSDERCVPPDHPESNYRMASEVLIQEIKIPPGNVHPMHCGDDPHASAVAYEATLRELYGHQDWPDIDLCLLGMGTDGHTASLFPDSPVLDEETRWVVAAHTPGVEHWRLTLTLPVINRARSIAFLVTGTDKDETLQHVLQNAYPRATLPAQLVRPLDGQLHWFLDAKAAQRLDRH